ncbi:hypothetical protein KQJ29_36410, partial [Enterococcus sp. S181_ASV_20]|nr:hypothetical protein [Enterococcus sp. S181_ASV_20]
PRSTQPTSSAASDVYKRQRKDTAEKYNLKKVSDLKRVAGELKAGVDTSWITRKGDGYEGFKQAYGLSLIHI